MAWLIVAALLIAVAILIVRDRNVRACLPANRDPLPMRTAPFFQLQCDFGETDIRQGRGIAAMVMAPLGDAADIVPDNVSAGTAHSTLVRIASPEGGFASAAIAYGQDAKELEQGDIVICVPIAFREHLAQQLGDPKLGWLWELRAQVDPFADPADGWKVLRRFEPPRTGETAMIFGRIDDVGLATPSITSPVIASGAKQSSGPGDTLDCFAALAMTGAGSQ